MIWSPIDPFDFWTSGTYSVGLPPYEFLASILLLGEKSTNLNVLGLKTP
jgi:hypothetical protein